MAAAAVDPQDLVPTEISPLLSRHDHDSLPSDAVSADGEAIPNGSGSDAGHVRDGDPDVARKMYLLIPAVGIGIYLCAVDQLLTVATYAKIGSELNALNNTSWIATAYFITLTSFQPLYGKLSDIFGRKECLLFSYVVFALGCLGCGLAQTFPQLCLARAVGGIGGGGMNSVVSILVSDLVPLRDRSVWQGYINVIFAAGTSTGAPLGGLLAESVGWRWSFLGQVPICAVAFLAVVLVLDVPAADHAHWRDKVRRIDFLGAAALISAVISLLVGLDAGSNRGWRDLRSLISLAVLTPLFSAFFLLVEMRFASHPFAPGHVIFDPALFACYAANFFGVAGQVAAIFLLPLFFQAVQAADATTAGALLVPPMVAAVIASLSAGLSMRRTGRYYALTLSSFGLLLLSAYPTTASIYLSSTPGAVAGLVGIALGAGSGITTTLVALLSHVTQADSAVVVACSYLFRSLGSCIGISISTAVLQHTLRQQLSLRLGDGPARGVEDKVRESLDFTRELDPEIAGRVRDSYRLAVTWAMLPATVFLAFGFLATVFIRERNLTK